MGAKRQSIRWSRTRNGYFCDLEEFDRSVQIVAAIREAVGPGFEIHVGGHGRFTPATALALARELAPYRPSWVRGTGAP